MRILYLGNNRVGYEVLRWLKSQSEEIVGLVVHPQDKRKYGDEIISAAGLEENDVIYGDTLREPETLARIQSLEPDLGISVLFDYILKADFLDILPQGCVNLHPAYLPFNRGQYPNVWSIIDSTTAGATLHYIDTGIDTGDIIARKEVPVEPVDTGESLYRKLEVACLELFAESWPALRIGAAKRIPQDLEAGTYHRTRDVREIDPIELDKTYVARDLINILRARTFSPHRGAYFDHDGSRIYMRLNLSYEDQVPS